MINIVQKKSCCGCTACYSSCPQNAISMVADEEGFLYPKVNQFLCIKCNICKKVCPIINMPSKNEGQMVSYVVRVRQDDILKKSTSGGFISPLANWIFQKNGIICGATYAKDFSIEHKIIEQTEMTRFRGSKYVQSNLNNCFCQIKKHLEQGIESCFVGTPCQVNGLSAFLGKKYSNLILVELVCHGTSSPKLWDRYLKYQMSKYNSDIVEISFRNKTYGYHSGTMKIKFANGKIYLGSGRVDYMLKSFFQEISSRPICYECPFKTLQRCSDFMIYDCWHASELVKNLIDDDRGYTNVIIQSKKGMEIFDKIKSEYEYHKVNTEMAVQLDGDMIIHSAKPHSRRSEYYMNLDRQTLSEHIQQYIPISKKDFLIENSKKYIYKLGIYQTLKLLKTKFDFNTN